MNIDAERLLPQARRRARGQGAIARDRLAGGERARHVSAPAQPPGVPEAARLSTDTAISSHLLLRPSTSNSRRISSVSP